MALFAAFRHNTYIRTTYARYPHIIRIYPEFSLDFMFSVFIYIATSMIFDVAK